MKTKKVLLVDDQPIELFALKSKLLALGVESVEVAKDGREAQKSFESDQFDLIFCDLEMPSYDGLSFLRYLHEQNYIGGVCILSGKDEQVISLASTMCNAFNFGFITYFCKPLGAEQLVKVLNHLFNSDLNTSSRGVRKKLTMSDFSRGVKSGELINFYQPKLDVKQNKVIGCEVLVRWNHPRFGILTPFDFMHFMETPIMADEVFDNVLRQALSDIKKYDISTNISVNASHLSFDKRDFSIGVLDKCHEYRVPANQLTIEIVETSEFKQSPYMLENFARLRLQGVQLSIDDFGTGHSSLLKLASLPFNELKIDLQFVKNCLVDERCKNIILTTIQLSESLNAKTVAEGVEDIETMDFLKKSGVDICQGYLFGKPMPIQDFVQHLNNS